MTPMANISSLLLLTCAALFQISQQPLFVPGVWGPYLSAMVPKLWLNEGGQSATGQLVSSTYASYWEFTQLLILPRDNC